ncbi:hypothetical protein [Domibacillus robiginosus]|uniref:hypothetical protein n=1 Tax=Domibacillus robiginosus TaxID=1071054 RepID=UPI00067B0C16|nr:hypothetical protein [Domibacillus robiginosus]
MFLGLLKKDFLLVKTYLWIWLAALLLLYMAGGLLASYYSVFYYMFPLLLTLYVGHTVIFPVASAILLKAEEKGQYWRHGTAGAVKLLGSKLMMAALFTITSLFLTNLFMVISWVIMEPVSNPFIDLSGSIPWLEGTIFNIAIVFGGLYFTLWGLFLWGLFHSLAQYPALKKFAWVIIFAVYFGTQAILTRLSEWQPVKNFLQSWSIQMELTEMSASHFGNVALDFTDKGGELLLWPILLSIAGLCILFWAASWLLDRKVEV